MANDPRWFPSYHFGTMAPVPRIGSRKPTHAYIREWRKRQGFTQQRLADALDTTKGTVSRWETDERSVTLGILNGICEVLDIPVVAIYRPPGELTIDERLASADEMTRDKVLEYADMLLKRHAS